MSDTDRMRAEFEAYMAARGFNVSCTGQWYNDPRLNFEIEIWRAACRAQARRDADICRGTAGKYDARLYVSDASNLVSRQLKMTAEEIEKDAEP